MISRIENHLIGPPNEIVPSGASAGGLGLGRFMGSLEW
jgi:hypothetical protein